MALPTKALEALLNLAVQLGAPPPDEQSSNNSSKSAKLLVWEDEDECDFSSFPSLSLEESPGNYHTGTFANRGDVECHVESLLSRPILWGQQQGDEDNEVVDLGTDDSLDEFFVDKLEEIPELMLNNFCQSFSTLMNSRLRAYATFLSRHAVSLANEKDTEGVIGIEQKLDTMLGIGSGVEARYVSSEFTLDQGKYVVHAADEDVDEDNPTYQASLPLTMGICIRISLPHAKLVDGDQSMNVWFQATGKMCGVFTKPSTDSPESMLLRAAEVKLNMHELLSDMAKQAACVISRIVEMTNAAYSVPLPHAAPQSQLSPSVQKNRRNVCELMPPPSTTRAADRENCISSLPVWSGASTSFRKDKKRAVSDLESDYDSDEDAIVSLSAEKCATIVDCVIGELDDSLLSPSSSLKKLKFLDDLPPLSIAPKAG